jgi:hypothetical protein
VRAVLQADGRVAHARVMHALDLLLRSGVAKVAFGVVPPSGPRLRRRRPRPRPARSASAAAADSPNAHVSSRCGQGARRPTAPPAAAAQALTRLDDGLSP